MIVFRRWASIKCHDGDGRNYAKHYEGWFLLGLIPVYVRQI